MKKFLIGCGVVILLGVIGLFATCYTLYRMGKGLVDNMMEIQTKYEAVDSHYSFKTPADGALTQAQIDRWLAVRKGLAGPSAEFKGIISGKSPGLSAVRKMFSLLKDLATEHAAALEANQMSSMEYTWITGQVLGVLTSDEGRKDPKLKPLIEAIERVETMPQAGQQQRLSLDAMAASLTSEQIAKLIPLIEARVDQIDESKDVFAFDSFILDMIEQHQSMSSHRLNQRSSVGDDEEEEEETSTPAANTGATHRTQRPVAGAPGQTGASAPAAATPAATPEETPEVSYH